MPCANMSSYLPARAKLWLGSLDNPRLEVRAQYNPKELQLDKQVPWGEHKAKKGQDPKKGARDTSEQSDLEFTGVPARSMTLELLFDTYERTGESVDKDIEILEQLSSVADPKSSKPALRRPHHCLVVWGASGHGMKPFRCVIESVSVKYTVWDKGGMPQRATCTVKLKEAHRMEGSKGFKDGTLYGEKRRPSWWTHEDGGKWDSRPVIENGEVVEKGVRADDFQQLYDGRDGREHSAEKEEKLRRMEEERKERERKERERKERERKERERKERERKERERKAAEEARKAQQGPVPPVPPRPPGASGRGH